MKHASNDRPEYRVECPHCGTVPEPGARFCQNCGRALAEGDKARAAAAPTTEIDADATRTVAVPAPVASGSGASGSVATSEDRLRRCPSCAAPNSLQRELCGRCGADLETGVLPPRPAPEPSAIISPGPATPEPAHHRTWLWIWVGAALVLLALLIAALAIFDVGPFAPRTPAAPTFEEASYPDDPEPLVLSDLATLTTRPPEGERSFVPQHMVDDDLTTAWITDVSELPAGANPRVDLFLEEPAWVERLVLATGDQLDEDDFRATSRIRRAQLTLDGGLTFVVNFLDERGLQAIEFRQPQLTTTVRLEVLETFEGTESEDIAISDLTLEGWVAGEEDAEQAQQRAAVRRAAGPSTDG